MIFVGGNIYVIEGKGFMYVFFFLGEIKLIKDVKYVLSFCCNILFIGKFMDDGNIVVFLLEFLCYIYLYKIIYFICFEMVR